MTDMSHALHYELDLKGKCWYCDFTKEERSEISHQLLTKFREQMTQEGRIVDGYEHFHFVTWKEIRNPKTDFEEIITRSYICWAAKTNRVLSKTNLC